MKNIFLTLILSFLFTASYSQFVNSIAVKSGMSFATQQWDYVSINIKRDLTYKNGSVSAISIAFFNTKNFSLITDFTYIQKGYKEQVAFVDVTNPDLIVGYGTIYDRFDFISMSPMLKFKIDIKSFSPYLIIGPRFDYCVGYVGSNDSKDIVNGSQKPIYGLSSGAGLEYRKNNFALLIEGQYLYDFSHFYNNRPPGGITNIVIDNKSYAIALGFKYYFKKK